MSGSAHAAFSGVKEQLKDAAFRIGADAVINCQFEYRVAVSTNAIGSLIGEAAGVALGTAQVIEIFAYGTAIKYIPPKT